MEIERGTRKKEEESNHSQSANEIQKKQTTQENGHNE